jgi:hypothetical protein
VAKGTTWYADVASGFDADVALDDTRRPGLMPLAASVAVYPSIKPWCTFVDSTNRDPADPNVDLPDGLCAPNAKSSAPVSK